MPDNIILSERFEIGAVRGPQFATVVSELSGGNEQRGIRWEDARLLFDLSYAPMPVADARRIEALFYARRGRARSYLVRDPLDNRGEGEVLGVGDGTKRDFQLVRTYEPDGVPYVRPILYPKAGTVTVWVNGAPAAFTLQPRGIVRLSSAPASGATVAAAFEFYVPVRFDTDELLVEMVTPTHARISGLRLIEVRE